MTRLVTYCIPWNSSTISKGLHALNLKELKRRICMVPRSERNGSSSILRSYWGWICRCHAWCWCFPRKRRTDNFWDNAYLISLELVVTLDESWYSEHQDWFCSMARTLRPIRRSSCWNGSYFGYERSEFCIRYSHWSTASRLGRGDWIASRSNTVRVLLHPRQQILLEDVRDVMHKGIVEGAKSSKRMFYFFIAREKYRHTRIPRFSRRLRRWQNCISCRCQEANKPWMWFWMKSRVVWRRWQDFLTWSCQILRELGNPLSSRSPDPYLNPFQRFSLVS